ncbi:C4-dicarboxylate ABC transporter permease [Tistrella bauzanensis]|uniref:TRAP transporter small permease protein n=1 Tax=Tistrella bauzanensis TaxID=657419 RepID=A0ABQ1JBY8_9PROT|nr:TRAP transporter small permease [Tistrella bauzanensis]GGB62666.1 C4-dicarboxylate ABC transporter permease [Tistrella bauzanensis]
MSTPSKSPAASRIENRTASLLVWGGGVALIVMAFVITIEALMRKFLNHSFGGVDEITSYVFAAASTAAFAAAVLNGTHIRIAILRDRLAPPLRVGLDLIAWGCLAVVFAILAWRGTLLAITSFTDGARSVTPMRTALWIPQGIWALGLTMTVLAALMLAVRAIGRLRAGDRAGAAALFAPVDEVASTLEPVISSGDTEKGPGR